MSTVLITGGHSGLGLEAATNLASMGLNLVLAGRNVESIEPVAAQLRSAHGIQVIAIKLDLSSIASVRSAVAACNAKIASGEKLPTAVFTEPSGGSDPGRAIAMRLALRLRSRADSGPCRHLTT